MINDNGLQEIIDQFQELNVVKGKYQICLVKLGIVVVEIFVLNCEYLK